MTDEPLCLEAILDLSAARRLLDAVRGARGRRLEVDASRVERIGAHCLQVLLAAQATWLADRVGFRLLNPSEAFLDGINLLGAGELMTAGERL